MTQHEIVTLSDTTATKLTPNGIHSGMDITVQNVNISGYIYLGGEGVSSSNYGYRLLPNHAFSVELPSSDSLFAIAENDEAELAVLKFSLEAQG
jgi:hypothetical protein